MKNICGLKEMQYLSIQDNAYKVRYIS